MKKERISIRIHPEVLEGLERWGLALNIGLKSGKCVLASLLLEREYSRLLRPIEQGLLKEGKTLKDFKEIEKHWRLKTYLDPIEHLINIMKGDGR